ncbi:MAG: glycosyltransferase family 1 protein, partial [Betaproteobacteria bacterium]
EDTRALASAFTQFLTSRMLLAEMGARGREKFERELAIEVSTKAIISIYNELNEAGISRA